jgi:hypothetical protein
MRRRSRARIAFLIALLATAATAPLESDAARASTPEIKNPQFSPRCDPLLKVHGRSYDAGAAACVDGGGGCLVI